MKKLLLILLVALVLLSLSACREAKEPEEIADVPNIDHTILDANRHLGNSFENYSSEDTLLVAVFNQ